MAFEMEAELLCLKIHLPECTIMTSGGKANPNDHFHFRPAKQEVALILQFLKCSLSGVLGNITCGITNGSFDKLPI